MVPDEARTERAREAARAHAQRLELPRALAEYEPFQHRASSPAWPTLSLDDYSGIPFLRDISGIEGYQHRARIRAGDGDLFATVTPATPGYESYCETRLGLGRVELIEAEPVAGPLEVSLACGRGGALARVVACARAAGGLVIHPYMGIEAVWELARRISEASGMPVEVMGPPPPVTWIANDKHRLSELARDAVGHEVVGPMFARSTVEGLADGLLELARRHPRVALKRTRCASAMGNRVYEAAELLALPMAGVMERVGAFWRDKECQPEEVVLAVAWEAAVTSPSTQLWIPAQGAGAPRLDGIYQQLLEGEEQVFLGSRPSTLPLRVEAALFESSYLASVALQELGYVGRCSFDFIVVGDVHGEFHVRITDCNGRWGGTSTPMHLIDRAKPGPRGMYLAQDFAHPDLVDVPFTEILRRAGDAAYDRRTGRGRYLFYNVGCLRGAGKLDVVVLGESLEEVTRAAQDQLPSILGL